MIRISYKVKKILAIPVFGLSLLAAGPASALVFHVPGEVGSLQEAVDAAIPGDVILVAPGDYNEYCELKGGLTIMGTGAGPEETVISGNFLAPVARISGPGEPIHIENLSMVDSYGFDGGAMIVEDGAVASFHRVFFSGNGCSNEGGALYVHNATVELRECFFYANYALGGGGGSVHIQVDPGRNDVGTHLIINCTFAANAGCCGATSLVMSGGRYQIDNNILEDVTCDEFAEATFHCNDGEVCGIDAGGNINENPEYCDFGRGDCRLAQDSPCLPQNNPDCGLIGAFGACLLTPTEDRSFSSVKALFR